jgi:hypothetical protein
MMRGWAGSRSMRGAQLQAHHAIDLLGLGAYENDGDLGVGRLRASGTSQDITIASDMNMATSWIRA